MVRILAVLAGTFALLAPQATAQISAGIASPAFDSSIYNKDAVAQSNRKFGNWNLICADVNGLNRRFCNISTIAQNQSGDVFLAMIISTTDAGKPAAILRMPIFVSLAQGIVVSAKSRKQDRKLAILTCEPRACTSVLPLQTSDIQTLANKGRMHFRFHLFAGLRPKPFDVVFDGTGFSEALQASQAR